MFEVVCFVVVIVLAWIWQKNTKRRPPGPIYGVPFLGHLPLMSKDVPRHLDKLKQKYGSVFGLYFASKYVVCLGDFVSMKEAFSKDAVLNRPPELPFAINPKSKSIMTMNGEEWKEQRRFAMKVFKSFAFSTKQLEHQVQQEVAYLLLEIKKWVGKPLDPTLLLIPSMSNIISSLTFGKRFQYSDPERIFLDELVQEIPRLAGQVSYFLYMPWMKKLLLWLGVGSCEKLRAALLKREHFVEKHIINHEKTYQEGTVRDYIDWFLAEMKQITVGTSFTRHILKGNVGSFFSAGSETVRTSIEWLLLVCAAYPDVQRRVQEEVHRVVGESRRPRWDDLKDMPYSQAVIWEIFRWKPNNPVNLLRRTQCDIEVKGYHIPKGTIIISCIWSIHNDPDFWEDPYTFKPERFLQTTETGELTAVKPEYLIPFSYGKRACPGEVIAKMVVFIYFTSILQAYNVKPLPGKEICFDEVLGVSLRPVEQNILFEERNLLV